MGEVPDPESHRAPWRGPSPDGNSIIRVVMAGGGGPLQHKGSEVTPG